MKEVRAKKHLGQHFLRDENIAFKIAQSFEQSVVMDTILEIGPGMGVLTQFLEQEYPNSNVELIELDKESVEYLNHHYPKIKVHSEDFLKFDLQKLDSKSLGIIGNYPYNISSQIIFKAIDNRETVIQLSGMFQKEVAERICADPGSKTYGVISVLAQAYYDCNYLFTVPPHVFNPPPKVDSGVMQMIRKQEDPDCLFSELKSLVKQAFNQRRKTLRNSLKSLFDAEQLKQEIFSRRPETLSVSEFVELVQLKAKATR